VKKDERRVLKKNVRAARGRWAAREAPGQETILEILSQPATWLETARHELEIADQARDHGGHSGMATRLATNAIREVREGIAYRDSHAP